MSNPYEAKAREAKARRIAACIAGGYGLLDVWDRTEMGAADAAERITNPAVRANVALVAGQRAPSDATWARVVELLRAMEGDEPMPEPVDPFAGLVHD